LNTRADWVRQRAHDPEPVSIDDVINSSLSFVGYELQIKGIVVSLDLAPELPQIVGDRVQLEQVVVNLTVNAIQAMAHLAPVKRCISIRTMLSDSGTVCCTIEDSGSGIDPEHLPRLFDQFFTDQRYWLGHGLCSSPDQSEFRGIIRRRSDLLQRNHLTRLRSSRF
jgi:signal transduction histidine kinase